MAPSEGRPDPRPPVLDVERATRTVRIDDATFPVLDHGEGPVVLMLHGFPDSRYLWRYQVPALIEGGFRVVAPDLRGYGDAPRPEGVSSYQLSRSIEDVLGILDRLEIDTVHLVGHDWGAAVAWLMAAYHPARIRDYAALSVGALGNSARFSLEQFERSWYIWFFQFEGVAEAWLRYDDWRLFRALTHEDGDVERHIEDLSRPGALTAALNWYRANTSPQPPSDSAPAYPDVNVPVLGVWSEGDHYLTEEYMTASTEKVSGPWRYERVADASHWFMLDKPAATNELLLDFLNR